MILRVSNVERSLAFFSQIGVVDGRVWLRPSETVRFAGDLAGDTTRPPQPRPRSVPAAADQLFLAVGFKPVSKLTSRTHCRVHQITLAISHASERLALSSLRSESSRRR